ncbi:CU044_5270 family protein [Nonomuraea sp. NPDC000554]|uniref:CU044_5270 family protein n=1 Tax=Nonomuraea sp. NPDC000554 TaxID=3154259 RepID=UPI003327B621
MDDEIRVFAEGRPAAPRFEEDARARARDRLVRETRGGRRFRLPRLGWQAAAAFGVTVTLVGGVAVTLSAQGTGAGGPGTSVSAAVTPGELDPKPGQFILVESDTMWTSESMSEKGSTHYLYRTHRKIWQSVDASANGLLLIEGREPKPWPGEQLPEEAKDWQGASWSQLASCPGRMGDNRRDYAYLSTLPTDPAALRERLYRDLPKATPTATATDAATDTATATANDTAKGEDADARAFSGVSDLLRETYLPRPQREALFETIKAIPGVQVAEGVEDSAGRKGVALGHVSPWGTLEQLIFTPDTHMLLGERSTVVDEKLAKAPKGSVLALTAQLNVEVVDQLPDAPDASEDGSCSMSTSEPALATPTAEMTAEMTATAEPVPTESAPTKSVPTESVPTVSAPTRTITPTPALPDPDEKATTSKPIESPAGRPEPTRSR